MKSAIGYSADSLDEIAEMCESFANNAKASPLQKTKLQQASVQREVWTWNEAARILRATKLTKS